MSWRSPTPWFAVTVLALSIVVTILAGWYVWHTVQEVRSACH